MGLGLIKEVDGALHISTRGRRLHMGLVSIVSAVLTAGVLLTGDGGDIPSEMWIFWVIIGLLVVLDQLLWAFLPRVIIDPRTRCIVLGKAQFPWSSYTGVVRVMAGPGRNKAVEPYSVHLVCADGARTRLARTNAEESQQLQYRVARMLELPTLPDEIGQ